VRPALEGLRDAVAGGWGPHRPDLRPGSGSAARRYAYQVLLVEEFRRCGAEVVFLNRAIGGSAEDDLLLQVQGVIAEYERAKILERGRRGRRHAARSGRSVRSAVRPMDTATSVGMRAAGSHVLSDVRTRPVSSARSSAGSVLTASVYARSAVGCRRWDVGRGPAECAGTPPLFAGCCASGLSRNCHVRPHSVHACEAAPASNRTTHTGAKTGLQFAELDPTWSVLVWSRSRSSC
jgi:hypothetical protein